MIQWNGETVATAPAMARVRSEWGRERERRFVLPAMDAAIAGRIDLALLTEPDGMPELVDGRPSVVGLFDAGSARGGCGFGPDAWRVVRHMRQAPPGLVVLDTALSWEAWQVVAESAPAIGPVLVVVCRPPAVPAWRAAFEGVAPVQVMMRPGHA